MTNVDALERLARNEGATNLALRNAVLEMIALYRFIQERYAAELERARRPDSNLKPGSTYDLSDGEQSKLLPRSYSCCE